MKLKFKIYNIKGEFLGIIHGRNAKNAIKEAKIFDMADAEIAVKISDKPVKRKKKEILYN